MLGYGLVRSASEFKQASSFGLAFHMVLTLWASYYAALSTSSVASGDSFPS